MPTPVGAAGVRVLGPCGAPALLVLGHGAGGGTDAPDLQAASRAALAAGWRVALVEQPWRLQGKRVAAPPRWLDQAWLAVVRALEPAPLLVLGGRSAGARVACRTAVSLGAHAVLALAFPLTAPNGSSRADEAAGAGVPLLVVQGDRDPFGGPRQVVAAVPSARVHAIAGGDHAMRVRRRDGRSQVEVLAEVESVVGEWLAEVRAG